MDFKNIRKAFLAGIGGTSMSGIAILLSKYNIEVVGSSNISSSVIEEMILNGTKIFIGHSENNITSDIDLYIYSAAISHENPELIACKNMGIKTVERGEFIGYLTSLYDFNIGISGTHGKTTCTGMIGNIFLSSDIDPTIHLGTKLKAVDTNFYLGKDDLFIVEACEYNESFLNFKQNISLITNIDCDHMEYFKTLDNIKNTFKKYINNLPEDGIVVVNKDDINSLDMISGFSKKIVTFGIDNTCSYQALNLNFKDACGTFDLYKKNTLLGNIKLRVPGLHNVYNALGSIAVCLEYGLTFSNIKIGIESFTGTDRRLDYRGEFKGAKVYDDYGHHPTEIDVTRKAIELMNYNKSWIIYEPLTYSRTANHLDEFGNVLSKFDNIILIDIYGSREVNTYGINSEAIVQEILKYNKNAIYVPADDVLDYLKNKVEKNDIILAMGPSKISEVINSLIK